MFDRLIGVIRRILDLFFWLTTFRDPVGSHSLSCDPTKIEINVRSPGGKQMITTVDLSSNVADMKRSLAPKLCPPSDDPETMRVIFAGKELSDEVRIEDCDLGPKSTIHVVFGRRRIAKPPASSPLPEVLASSLAEPPEPSAETEDGIDDNEWVNVTRSTSHGELNESSANADDSSELTETVGSLTDVAPSPKRDVVSFYVLCSWRACPGKLRVRCSLCGEGALTVLRDPESWDDVLKSSRVPASCENSSCPSLDPSPHCPQSYAVFYFKCAEHRDQTDLTPLPLVRQNSRNVPCLSCTGVDTPVLVFPCVQGHVVCIECFVTYCNTWLNERRFVVTEEGYSICCPAGCENSWINQSQHFKLLGKEQYEKYQMFATEDYVLRSGGSLCPQPGCGMGILPAAPDAGGCGDQRRVVCDRDGGCGYVFCKDCRMGYHFGPCDGVVDGTGGVIGVVGRSGGGDGPCVQTGGFTSSAVAADVLAERARTSVWSSNLVNGENESELTSVRTVRLLSKPCPMCRVSTERNGGCMHMTCRCGFSWCWVCQTEWTRECMASHWFI